MTDTLTKAKELIERFEGKLRDWTSVGDDEHRTVRIDDFNVPTTEIEYEYITECRDYITIIKELLGMFESQRNWNIRMEADHDVLWSEVSETRQMNEKLEQENQALKQRAKVAETKLRRLICYMDIEKIENENKALKDRLAELEGGE